MTTKNTALIVILSALVVSALIFFGGNGNNAGDPLERVAGVTGNNDNNGDNNGSVSFAVSEDDLVRGSRDASVTIIEYADFNCTFCARLHPTLSRIVDEYDGDVNWVYRHFANYPSGRTAAIGSECVARLGGNDVFWEFAGEMFDNQRRLGDSFSTEVAVSLGLNKEDFQECLQNEKREIEEKMEAHRSEAIALGGRGTPFMLIVNASGDSVPASGAQPYESLKSIIDGML